MILKGSTTSSISHAGRLANHLLNERDNDQVQVLEIAGQQTDDPKQAMLFMHGAVTLTRGKKGLFQVSINPEEGEVMTHEQWDDAVVRVEKEFGLIGQPRIIVEHIKEGRKHRHIVWQRTNYETEKLVVINDYKTRLVKQAREMERDYGHRIVNDYAIGPKFDQAAHRQAKRLQKKDDQALDPKNRSAFIREAWERSENADDFVKALKDGGLELAQGNKARMVLLHSETGEIIKGSLGRHLKCPDKGIVRAAELREWANGLSAPLQDVEATQERLKANKDQWDDVKENRTEKEKKALSKEDVTMEKQPEVWDRDQYAAEQIIRDSDAGIEHAKAIEQDEKEQRAFARNYRSYAAEMDPVLKKERKTDQERREHTDQMEEYYQVEAKQKKLLRLKKERLKYNKGIRATIAFKSEREKLDQQIWALEKGMENIEQRQAEAKGKLERQIAEKDAANENTDLTKKKRDLRRQAIRRKDQQRDKDRDLGYER